MIKSLLANLLPARWTREGTVFHVQGVSATVHWLPTGEMNSLGRTTVLNTIYLDERIKREYPHHVVEYVVLHELGHASRSRAFRTKHFGTRIILAILTVGLGLLAFIFASTALQAGSTTRGGVKRPCVPDHRNYW